MCPWINAMLPFLARHIQTGRGGDLLHQKLEQRERERRAWSSPPLNSLTLPGTRHVEYIRSHVCSMCAMGVLQKKKHPSFHLCTREKVNKRARKTKGRDENHWFFYSTWYFFLSKWPEITLNFPIWNCLHVFKEHSHKFHCTNIILAQLYLNLVGLKNAYHTHAHGRPYCVCFRAWDEFRTKSGFPYLYLGQMFSHSHMDVCMCVPYIKMEPFQRGERIRELVARCHFELIGEQWEERDSLLLMLRLHYTFWMLLRAEP